MDLVEKETQKWKFLKSYLPQSLSKDEIIKVIDQSMKRLRLHLLKISEKL